MSIQCGWTSRLLSTSKMPLGHNTLILRSLGGESARRLLATTRRGCASFNLLFPWSFDMKRDPIFDFPFGFQTGLDPAPLQIVQRLLGTVDVPPDHPCPADVFKNLCTGFCAYTSSLGNCTVEFNHLVNEIRLLQVALDALPLTDTTPIFQLDR